MKIDEAFIKRLSKEELEQFKSDQVVLDEYNWLRYKNEIMSGCNIADQSFLDKVKEQYPFSFEVDDVPFEKPSVFLLGKQDSVVGYQDALNIMDKYPRSTFAVLDIAGHNLQIEQPQVFHALINEWLDRIET